MWRHLWTSMNANNIYVYISEVLKQYCLILLNIRSDSSEFFAFSYWTSVCGLLFLMKYTLPGYIVQAISAVLEIWASRSQLVGGPLHRDDDSSRSVGRNRAGGTVLYTYFWKIAFYNSSASVNVPVIGSLLWSLPMSLSWVLNFSIG